MLEVPLLTEDQCRVVAEATAETISVPGFVPTFSLFDPSSEVPVQDLPSEVRYRVVAVVCAGWNAAVRQRVRLSYVLFFFFKRETGQKRRSAAAAQWRAALYLPFDKDTVRARRLYL